MVYNDIFSIVRSLSPISISLSLLPSFFYHPISCPKVGGNPAIIFPLNNSVCVNLNTQTGLINWICLNNERSYSRLAPDLEVVISANAGNLDSLLLFFHDSQNGVAYNCRSGQISQTSAPDMAGQAVRGRPAPAGTWHVPTGPLATRAPLFTVLCNLSTLNVV